MTSPPDIRAYWDRKIIEWEDSIRTRSKVSPLERLAARFRKPIVNRAQLALEILAPHVRDRTVLELGCGSGFFARNLQRVARPAHVTGVDFSSAAIHRAQEQGQREGLSGSATFLVGNAAEMELPRADVTIGLGFLDYLDQAEIRGLFARIQSPWILFTFSRSDRSLRRALHILYLKTQDCPKHFYHSERELRELVGERFGELVFLADRARMSFGGIFHNLRRA